MKQTLKEQIESKLKTWDTTQSIGRDNLSAELLKLFEDRGLDDLDVAVFKTRGEMNKYFKHPRFAATFESKLRTNFIEAQKEAVEKYH